MSIPSTSTPITSQATSPTQVHSESESESESDILSSLKLFTKDAINIHELTDCQLNMYREQMKTRRNTYFTCNDDYNIASKFKEILNINRLFRIKLLELENNINTGLDNICEHNWVDDSIDIRPDASVDICYCSKCNISKIL